MRAGSLDAGHVTADALPHDLFAELAERGRFHITTHTTTSEV